jgi:hypothetical protein
VSEVPDRDDVVVVAHSGAGPLLPAIGAALAVAPACYLFVDARMPAVPGATAELDDAFRQLLESLARDGVLPKWSEWWGPDAMESLIPDADRRRLIDAEMPRLPLDFFDEAVLTPADWSGRAGYLQLSPAYDAEAEEAVSRGWTVDVLAGGHLQMAVDPVGVADRLLGRATIR